jgi:hypothetical protein
LFKLISNPSYKQGAVDMKIAAVAAGGGRRAEKVVRDFYVASLLKKKDEACPSHLVNHDWIEKSNSAGVCKCCCGCLFSFALFIFILVWGFPGLMNTNKFPRITNMEKYEIIN